MADSTGTQRAPTATGAPVTNPSVNTVQPHVYPGYIPESGMVQGAPTSITPAPRPAMQNLQGMFQQAPRIAGVRLRSIRDQRNATTPGYSTQTPTVLPYAG